MLELSGKKWAQISIRTKHYEVLEKRAEKNRRSVAGELEMILIDAGIIKPLDQEVKASAPAA